MNRYSNVIMAAFLAASGASALAAEVVIAGDGKKFRLNDNGTWEVVSEDRVLDTDDGRRVVLKADGTWEYLGLAPKAEATTVQTLTLAATIKGIAIDEVREKVGKNTRTESITTVELELGLASTAPDAIDLTALANDAFVLTDNQGRRYPIIAIDPSVARLEPGQAAALALQSDKAPKGLKKMIEYVLAIAPKTLSNEAEIELTFDYDRVRRSRVLK